MKKISCFVLSLVLCFQCITPAMAANDSSGQSNGIWGSIGGALGSAWDWATGAAEDAGDKTTTVYNDAREKVGNAISSAGDATAKTANQIWDSTTNVANSAWDATTNAADNAWTWTQVASGNALTWSKGAANDAWGWTSNAAGTTWNWTKNTADEGWNWTQGAADTAWTWTQDASANAWNWTCETASNAWSVTSHSLSNTWNDMFGETEDSKKMHNLCVSSPLLAGSELLDSRTDENGICAECFCYDYDYDVELLSSKRPEDILPPSVGDMDFADLVASNFDSVTFAQDVAAGAGVRALAQELRFKAIQDDVPKYGRALGVWTDHYIVSFVITTDVDPDTISDEELEEIDEFYDLWLETISVYETDTLEADNLENSESQSTAGLLTVGGVQTANRIFDEVRFRANNGHGFAAEQANDLIDDIKGVFKGQKATVVGNNNAKNGPDRLITSLSGEQTWIQTKYYKTASASIGACFEDGGFRYYSSDGMPMKIEVPSDQYDDALGLMQKRIDNGDVVGVTNADEIVQKGNITYKQAKNIAKAGTIDSLKYDAARGCVESLGVFGISAAVDFAVGVWNGEDVETALKQSVETGLTVGGTNFVISVLASQLSKTGLNSALTPGSEAIVKALGPKAAASYVNAFRKGGNIYGAAAMKSAAKMLRGQFIVSSVSFIVMSIPDVVDSFRGRMSGRQLLKNAAENGGGIIGGLGGWYGGALLGSMICPGVGTVIGGIVGSVAGGYVVQVATAMVADVIADDDADIMLDLISEEFAEMAEEYLLGEEEANEVMEYLTTSISGDALKDMYASSSREVYGREVILRPVIEEVVAGRNLVELPTAEEYQDSMIEVLEEIAEEEQLEDYNFEEEVGIAG